MRGSEQQTLDQMLLHREFSVVARTSGNAEVYASIARTTGGADNGNQYWVQMSKTPQEIPLELILRILKDQHAKLASPVAQRQPVATRGARA